MQLYHPYYIGVRLSAQLRPLGSPSTQKSSLFIKYGKGLLQAWVQNFHKSNNKLPRMKYHRIAPHHSEVHANALIKQILTRTDHTIFAKNALGFYQGHMAKEIVTAEQESMEQLRAHSPEPAALDNEDVKSYELFYDSIRPFSAKVQRVRKINTETNNGIRPGTSKTNIPLRSFKTMKSFQSNKNLAGKNSSKDIGREIQKSDLGCYKSRLVKLKLNDDEEENDKFIEQLRRRKLKAEQYQRQKQNFLNSISKENEQYSKKQAKFASTLTRKDYTYNYKGQVVELIKNKKNAKKSEKPDRNTFTTAVSKNEQQLQEPKSITVQFSKRQQRPDFKEYVFGTGIQRISPQLFCPSDTQATRFTIQVEDL